MNDTLLKENSNGGAAAWDMGTGEEHGQPQPAPTAEKSAAPAPAASQWRHTTTPQPEATHGVQDAAGLTTGSRAASPQASKFGGNIPDLWEYDTDPFPDDLQKCYAILRKIDSYWVQNRRASKEQLRRRGLLGKHIAKISNGPKPIEMTADIIAGMQKAQHERPAQMNARLAEIQAYLASPISAEISAAPGTLFDSDDSDADARQKLAMVPKSRLLSHPAVLQWIQIGKRLACAAEKFALDNFDLINPTEHVQLLERELRNSSDPARIRELQSKISKAKENGSYRTAEVAIKGEAAKKWEPVFDALRSAITVSQLLAVLWEDDAEKVEQGWFGEFGIERHQTFLSKQFTDLRAELGKLNVSKTTFAWFGVNDIAESDE